MLDQRIRLAKIETISAQADAIMIENSGLLSGLRGLPLAPIGKDAR